MGRRRARGALALGPLMGPALVGSRDGFGSHRTQGDPTGSWGAQSPGEANLRFTADGAVTGSDGCNRLIGTWHTDGDAVRLDDLASTRMSCPGVDPWLSRAAWCSVEDSTLVVTDADGTRLGTLRRGTRP